MSFIEKIISFGWAEDGRFDEDNETLTRAVARYHAWLDLMHSMHGKFVVPTLVHNQRFQAARRSIDL